MKHPLMNYNRLLYHIVFRTKHSLPAITEAALWGGPIPQVSFAIAHFTSLLSIVLPLQGNSTSSNEVVVTYKS